MGVSSGCILAFRKSPSHTSIILTFAYLSSVHPYKVALVKTMYVHLHPSCLGKVGQLVKEVHEFLERPEPDLKAVFAAVRCETILVVLNPSTLTPLPSYPSVTPHNEGAFGPPSSARPRRLGGCGGAWSETRQTWNRRRSNKTSMPSLMTASPSCCAP